MSPPVFRFAPSPNGRLHLGHAYSALLNEKMAREAGGRFLLRIEDIDRPRCTDALTEAMLADLAWLGLAWEEPVLRQSEHLPDYQAAQRRLRDKGLLYPCFCSRRDIALATAETGERDPEGQPLYPGTCRHLSAEDRSRRLANGEPHAWRLAMDKAVASIGVPLYFSEEGSSVPAQAEAWGDVVLARKDIGTSYHIAVVVDDARQGVTQVVRGRDLFHATSIHLVLQHLLGLPTPRYLHHALIDDAEGRKLSKSLGSKSLADLRAEEVTAQDVWQALGFE
ncbi:tRNA glutamyl-Q(34) synthetase GluQRS [Taklimakanibacter albus]|uniref:tRNA glutamyl-Q(34) synthetase GluQRS n=1 Tax=Taklimakanibacter albus TaxID=2800327 RepID=A0ACC5RFZ4_9HYPH|nr:tRNA glutamyl-Q(34) synthetase GluQRS [Aestuariivirga sp. YIM B02566]MBK1871527.1 tRNA glutamyl-Q(34) synthetase GluQRS [Aestuariivirga sp. YIM B02566]